VTELLVTHSIQSEIERVRFTLSKLPWYGENGYKVDIPAGLTEHSTESEIAKRITDEYIESEYENTAALLRKSWSEFLPRFEDVKNKKAIVFNDSYTVKFTKYGTNGSYFPSKSLILMKFKGKTPEKMLGTLVHEMIHISIHSLIEEFKVSHWRKERLVDLITEELFPGLKPLQNIKEDVHAVDDSFRENFPDIQKTIIESGLVL
jgi:hypothetical protein